LIKTQLFSIRTGRTRGLGVTGNYLDSVHLGEVGILAELHLLQHESPDVVAETVGVQFVGLKVEFSFDPGVESGVDGFVELDENPESQGRAEHLVLHQLVQTLLEGVAQSGVPVQLVGHGVGGVGGVGDWLLVSSSSESQDKMQN